MSKFKKIFNLFIMLGLIVSSCEKQENSLLPTGSKINSEEQGHNHSEDEAFEFTNEQIATQIEQEKKLLLGAKLENPYSIENMKRAQARTRLHLGQNLRNEIEVKTTDLYVRFLPKDINELNLLEEDTTLELYAYPLDYEIEQIGDYYRDLTLPISAITWQYTVVPKGYAFPNIQYEIIEHLFLIESAKLIYPTISEDYWNALENEAFIITDNLDDTITGSRAPSWNPSGKIKVQQFYDTKDKGEIGINNVKVRARRWFTTKTDYTNSSGYYYIDAFKGAVNYDVVFETNYAQVTNAVGMQTIHGGPSSSNTSWNTTFVFSGNSWVRATLINGMGLYRTRVSTLGIQNPYNTTYWAGGNAVNKLDVRAVFASGTSAIGLHMGRPGFNDIKIWSQNSNGTLFQTDFLYWILFHELGHRSHFKISTWNFSNASNMLTESWAEYIKWKIMVDVFPFPLSVADVPALLDIDLQGARSILSSQFQDGYTSLFIDLADTENQRTTHGGDTNFPDDNVSGYTHAQIQDALATSTKIADIRDYLINNYNNPTENQLNTYFNFMIPFE